MQISKSRVEFGAGQIRALLHMSNPTAQSIIFKLKVNNLQLLTINPSRGYIFPSERQVVTISSLKDGDFFAKLQICEANRTQQPGKTDTFDCEWQSISPENIRTLIVEIVRPKIPNEQSEIEGGLGHSSSVSHQSHQSQPNQPPLTIYKSVSTIRESTEKKREIEAINNKLQLQLANTRELLSFERSRYQFIINASLSQPQQNQVSSLAIIVCLIAMFLLGFTLASE